MTTTNNYAIDSILRADEYRDRGDEHLATTFELPALVLEAMEALMGWGAKLKGLTRLPEWKRTMCKFVWSPDGRILGMVEAVFRPHTVDFEFMVPDPNGLVVLHRDRNQSFRPERKVGVRRTTIAQKGPERALWEVAVKLATGS